VGSAPAQISWNFSGDQGVLLTGGAGLNNIPFTAGNINCSDACTDPAACNYDPTAPFTDNTLCEYLSCIGCSDPLACNYDVNAPVGSDDCDYSCVGCTNTLACNYASTATIDDGSCCLSNCVTLALSDVGGNGWQGANLTAINAVTNEVVISTTLQSGSGSSNEYCITSGCYDVSVSAGSAPNEIGWNLNGEIGGAGSVTTLAVGVPSCDPFCLIPLACNYNSQGVIGDCNLCEFDSCQGCTYPDATNFNPGATIDDGSCIFELGNPNCPADINGDGFVSVADLLIFIAEYGTICN
ncbi:MAG: hypothetical protein ACKOW8_05930, partial [Flavobacteriales bacterium]